MTQIFVGGLNKTSGVPAITSYFSTFGTVSEVKIVSDRKTGLSRGFGFVTFEDASAASDVLTRQSSSKLEVEGATVECKPMSTGADTDESKSAKKKKKTANKKRKADDDDGENGAGEYLNAAKQTNTSATPTPSASAPIKSTPSVAAAAPSKPAVTPKKAKITTPVVVHPIVPAKPAAAPGTQVFVGGIPKTLTADALRAAFVSYGTIVDSSIMLDRHTHGSRGFGFVTFAEPSIASGVVAENGKVQVEGNTVTLKLAETAKPKSAKALAKEAKDAAKAAAAAAGAIPVVAKPSATPAAGGVLSATAKKKAAAKLKKSAVHKIFVGGLSQTMTTANLQEYFQQYGHIIDCVVMQDPETKRSRGFGFVSFASEDSYRAALKLPPNAPIAIKGKGVITPAAPKEEKKEKKAKKRRWGDDVDTAAATPTEEPSAPAAAAAPEPVVEAPVVPAVVPGGETMVGHEIAGWKITCRPARDKRSSESHY